MYIIYTFLYRFKEQSKSPKNLITLHSCKFLKTVWKTGNYQEIVVITKKILWIKINSLIPTSFLQQNSDQGTESIKKHGMSFLSLPLVPAITAYFQIMASAEPEWHLETDIWAL